MDEKYNKVDNCPNARVLKASTILEKAVFVISVVTVIFLSHVVVHGHWLLPFYYVTCTPILLLFRFIYYWRMKWLFFMIDFCYFANLLCYVFVWLADIKVMFDVVFALANGPLLWAMVIYGNALVFHDTDRVTSIYIHLAPALLSYGIRWFPENTSRYWYKDFVSEFYGWSAVWLMAVPMGCFLLHSLLYFCIVNVIVKPSEEYDTSFSYLQNESSPTFKLFNIFGSRWRTPMYYLLGALFCLLTLCSVLLMYNFYIAHCAILSALFLICIFNGGCYYMDVFSVQGFA